MAPNPDAAPPPNVLLILTDDQGFDDLGCHGNPLIDTPHLDRLAGQAVRFDNFYVAPVCAPTRAALMTGRYFLRTGVSHVHGGKDFVHPDETLIGELFQRAGYVTGLWGKWHSGKTTGYFPWERGFDEAYMARLYQHKDSVGRFNGEPREHTGWTVDTLTDYALEFISRHRGRPWFTHLPYLTVHAPLVAPDDRIAKYRQRGCGDQLATIYAMIEQLDDNVGRLLDHLDATGQADNTIVVFLSDNGPQFFPEMSEADKRRRYVNRYKGHKGSMWENGIKAPLFVRWGERFAPRAAERVCDVCDLLPTLLELCGIERPTDALPLDGRSVVPLLEGREADVAPEEKVVFSNLGWPPEKDAAAQAEADRWEYRPVPAERKPELRFADQLMALRTERHKLLWRPGYAPGAPAAGDGRVLIDIAADPREDRNVLDAHADLGDGMRDRLRDWFDRVKTEPHAYHTPRFALGPGTTNVVYLYAPHRLRGNVRNGGTMSFAWQAAGDGADYLVDVRRPGRYRVTLDVKRVHSPATLRLTCGSAKLEAAVTDPGQTTLGKLGLPEGPGEMTLDLLHVDPASEGEPTGLDHLLALHFDPA